MAASFKEGQPIAVDIAHSRVGTVDYGDGPEETTKVENVTLAGSELSDSTIKLLRSLGGALVADALAIAKTRAVAAQQVAADTLKEAQRVAAQAKEAEARAAENVSASGGA